MVILLEVLLSFITIKTSIIEENSESLYILESTVQPIESVFPYKFPVQFVRLNVPSRALHV